MTKPIYCMIMPLFLVLLPAAATLACSESSSPEIRVARIVVSGRSDSLAPTTTRTLSATLSDAQGGPITGRTILWSSDDIAVATVAQSGVVTGVAPGATTIRATSGAAVGTLAIGVDYPACTTAMASGSIIVGQTINGTFTHAGCTRNGLGPYKGYALVLTQPLGVTAKLHSPGASSFVTISPMFGPDVAIAASTAPGDTAQASADLPAGFYWIWGRTENGVLGTFRLRLDAVTICTAANASNGLLAATDSVAGSILSTSCVYPLSNRATGWSMTLDTATSIRLDATSSAFLPDVFVTDTLLNGLAWSITGQSTATLVTRLPAGRYLAWVTKLGQEFGTFTLRRRDYFTALCTAGPLAGDLPLGAQVNGALEGSDCRLVDSRYADRWRLVIPSDTTVRIDLAEAGAIDPYLYLFDSTGVLLAEDNDSGGNFGARITRTLTAGSYWVMATSKPYAGVWAPYLLSAMLVTAP